MIHDEIFFKTVKESRDWYFVEYTPPNSGFRFATLVMVIPGDADAEKERVAETIEVEMRRWLQKYPVPVFVSACDGKDDLVELQGIRACSHLIGFTDENGMIQSHWRLLGNEELPSMALDRTALKAIYSDIGFKTGAQVQGEVERQRKAIRLGWLFVFIWAVIIPGVVAVLEWWSDWLAGIVVIYSLFQATKKALELMGKWPKSKKQIEREAEELQIRHHHYHCKENPRGFQRLALENFERWERQSVLKEAESLKKH